METRNEKTQSASRSPNLGNLADPTHRALVLFVILGASERAGDAGRATVNWSERSGADVKFRKGVEFDLDLVLRVPLALRLDLPGLLFGTLVSLFAVNLKNKSLPALVV